jgi:hypothetical protein
MFCAADYAYFSYNYRLDNLSIVCLTDTKIKPFILSVLNLALANVANFPSLDRLVLLVMRTDLCENTLKNGPPK